MLLFPIAIGVFVAFWAGIVFLTIGADGRGLSLGISSIFRFGYPELFVPWSAIVATQQGDRVAFRMAGVSLCLEAALAENMRLASLS